MSFTKAQWDYIFSQSASMVLDGSLPLVRRPPPPKAAYSAAVPIETMPTVFTFALVDEVAEKAKLSKGKARKAIRHGKVTVNGTVTYDPDLRLDHTARVVVSL